MQDMSKPLTATKGTLISLLAGPHSQGGSFKPQVSDSWESISLPISFTSVALSGVNSPNARNLSCGIALNNTTQVTMYVTRNTEKCYWLVAGF